MFAIHKGYREDMEDAHAMQVGATGAEAESSKKLRFFGVFDGHAGANAAKHCAKQLPKYMTDLSNDAAITRSKSILVVEPWHAPLLPCVGHALPPTKN